MLWYRTCYVFIVLSTFGQDLVPGVMTHYKCFIIVTIIIRSIIIIVITISIILDKNHLLGLCFRVRHRQCNTPDLGPV